MQERYADWWVDLPEEPVGPNGQPQPGWRTFFTECPDPDFEAIPENLQITDDALVWPGRRNAPHDDAPEGAHICRAFDWIEPEGVRVVVLGQNPYPAISSATGRAFEDGTPDAADEALRPALRNLGLSALDLHGAACPPGFCHSPAARAAAIRDRFDALAGQGVLCLNASWTFTKKKSLQAPADDHPGAHRAMWKPVTEHLLRKIADRPNCVVVFLLFGRDAQEVAVDLDLPRRDSVTVVEHTHPTAPNNGYFGNVNPFEKVNDALQDLEQAPITWWVVPQNADAP
ncbi:uracil-DNA glycosylase family protein [Roseovarius sp.]|uniref:uracil-DNA glycosylase family protein n=1 Tax=Roseovarius sp. TaxID=1486281 RepID=UPI0035683989